MTVKIDTFLRNGENVSEVLTFNLAAKWLIATLAERNVPFRVLQLGGGVKRITTETDVCPKCNGTGRC